MRSPTLLALALAGCCGARAAPPKAPETPAASQLPTWMEGAWVSDDGKSTEHWHVVGGALFGVGFPAEGPGFEVMLIDVTPEGQLRFTAWPGGDGGVVFRATSQTGDRVVFANPAHDFPKEVSYWRAGGTLSAFIGPGGGEKAAEYRWRAGPATSAAPLEGADRQFDVDTKEKRSAGWAAWFDAEGAQWRPKRGRIVGPEAIRELMRPAFDEKGLDLRWIPRRSGFSPKGDLGFTVGDYVTTTKTGEKGTGGYVTVWKKQADGGWKVLFDTGT
jgi:hypothetical protein